MAARTTGQIDHVMVESEGTAFFVSLQHQFGQLFILLHDNGQILFRQCRGIALGTDHRFHTQFVEARGGKEYYMRGTFTHANPDFLKDIQTMLDLGFSELSMEPVVCAEGDPSGLTPADLEIVMDQYEKLAELMLERDKAGKPFTFYHYMIDLTGGPCIYKRISGCGSGTEYMAVTPWGDLYPCHQFVGEERFKLGNIWDGVTNTDIQAEFAACNVYAHPECHDCWARLYCSGGCAANAYHATGSVTGVYESGCKLFRKRMECAIMVAIARMLGQNG